jgi:ornithine carbamoyltransferase
MGELLDADVIVTDSWPGDVAGDTLASYRIGTDVLDRLREDAIFLPCPPVTGGREVTGEAVEHPLCRSRRESLFTARAERP